MSNNNIKLHDGLSRPVVGSIMNDMHSLRYKIFDGTEWIDIPYELQDIKDMSALQQMLVDRRNISDSWLETKYPDLQQLRTKQETEYKQLSDKYRVFEILNRSGEQ